MVKSVQDLKLSVESISFSKTQLNSQLEEARRRLEEDDRRRSMLESSLHQVETELESIRLQLEEESEARLDLERQLVKANGEAGTFKSKYEAECMARAEEVEEIRRKYTVRITESEEHIESLQARLSKLEKEKSRLTSEIEVLIIDLEKANNGIREYTKRIEILEKTNIEIKTRLEETIALYDASQRDLRQRTADFQRLSHELDKTREQKDQLGRDNNKLQNELHESRSTVTELTRRLHEYEVELRRLENEREELTAAYKEAEAVSVLNNYFDWKLKLFFNYLTSFRIYRDAKQRRNVLRPFRLSMASSVMTLSVAYWRRTKRLKSFGKYGRCLMLR